MSRGLAFDQLVGRQDHRAGGTVGGHVLGLHHLQELLTLLLGLELHVHARAEFARRIVQLPHFDSRQIGDALVDALRIGTHITHNAVQLPQLRQQHAAGELAHAEVGSDERCRARFAELLQERVAQTADVVEARGTFKQQRIAGNHRTTLAGGKRLVGLQTVDAQIRDGADRAALVAGTHALRAIFHHADVVLARDGHDALQVRRIALQVHRHNELGGRRDMPFDVVGIEVEALVDFSAHRQRSGEHHGVEAGVPGPTRNNHFVAGPDPECGHGALQRRGSARHRQRVLGLHARGQLGFERRYFVRRFARTIPTEGPSGFEDVEHHLALLVVVILDTPEVPAQRRAAHRCAALRRQARSGLTHGGSRGRGGDEISTIHG